MKGHGLTYKPLTLPPRIHGMVERFLREEQTLFDLVDAFGSPLNLIFPTMIDENIAAFQRVYDKHFLKGTIFYTTKPNKASSIVRQAALADVGVDVSSEDGLKIALGCGFHPSRIECTGPKNMAYLTLAVQQGIIINADNFEELEQIIAVRQALGIQEKTKIFIRLAGFKSERIRYTAQDNTFGIDTSEAPRIFHFLDAHKNEIDFLGFSFHFRAAGLDHKALAIESVLELSLKAIEIGISVKGINIGGGLDIQYARSAQEWAAYVENLKSSMLDPSVSMTWNNTGLGFHKEDGKIKGSPNFVQHYMPSVGAEDLDILLNKPLPALDGNTAGQILADCGLELYIEPGRALLDQMGITIGRGVHVKKSTFGETLVALDMNRSGLHSTHQKLLTDPIILRRVEGEKRACPEGVYYIGNLCLSYDMITYNKTFPDFLPQEGDLVVFVNTAAYLMDFVESRTLHQRLAEKVVITEQDGRFRWFKDEIYNPATERYLEKRVA